MAFIYSLYSRKSRKRRGAGGTRLGPPMVTWDWAGETQPACCLPWWQCISCMSVVSVPPHLAVLGTARELRGDTARLSSHPANMQRFAHEKEKKQKQTGLNFGGQTVPLLNRLRRRWLSLHSVHSSLEWQRSQQLINGLVKTRGPHSIEKKTQKEKERIILSLTISNPTV